MADLEALRRRVDDGLEALQVMQAEYDLVGWDIKDPPFEKFRHISFHLAMMAGQVSTVCEAGEHAAHRATNGTSGVDLSGSREQMQWLVADMLFHSAQIANMLELDLSHCLIARYVRNAGKFAPDSQFVSLAQE
ncbi:MAG: hypothetical protein ABI824_06095 [Acidobacteriota bacterium]